MRYFGKPDRREGMAWTASFLGGFIVAVALFCLFAQKMVYATGFLDAAYLSKIRQLDIDQNGLFLYSLVQRLKTAAFLVLLAAAGAAGIGNCLFVGWSGFCAGALLTVFSMRCGLFGTVLFLGSIFPQVLLFIPGYLQLLDWCMKRKEPKKLLAALAVIVAACFLESYVNPAILKLLMKLYG